MKFVFMLSALTAIMPGLCALGCHRTPKFEMIPLHAVESVSSIPGAPVEPDDIAKHVLVVMNTSSSESEAIASYYVKARHIPKVNVCTVAVRPSEQMPGKEFYNTELLPIKNFIKNCPNTIDYIVVTKGLPIATGSNQFSADAMLVAMDKIDPSVFGDSINLTWTPNPYYNQTSAFTHKQYGIYLVTRLDGYTEPDILGLVDHSLAAKRESGLFYFLESTYRTKESYGELQKDMTTAAKKLESHGFDAFVDKNPKYSKPTKPVMGYFTWGSNNGDFNEQLYEQTQFLPGAIAETLVSTSARTLEKNVPGQSQIGPLIHSGVTGVKGYVSEPYTLALCVPSILFDRYTSGFNLAESFYMASPVIEWKDLVIGDPICSPY